MSTSTPEQPTPETTPETTEAPVSPAATQQPARSNQTVVFLLSAIAALLAVIAVLLATGALNRTSSSSAPATPAVASAVPSAEPTSAPAQTDPQVLELLKSEIHRDPQDSQAQGKVDAPVVMVIYSDFACPYCTLFAQEVEPGLADLVKDGTLRIEWRDLAQITQTSPLAAQAGIAAANQGRFWELHDAVYAAADPNGHPTYTEDSLVAFAQQAGVSDLDRFRTDMLADTTAQTVASATQHAHDLGITGTPFIIINDTVISGYRPLDYVRATVTEAAGRAA